MSNLAVWSKSLELIENVGISADSTFLFWAIEPKRKRGIDGMFGKGPFKLREIKKSHFFWKEIDSEVI